MSSDPLLETSAPSDRLPADFRAEVAEYDRRAEAGVWEGPRYRVAYRVLGEGPPLVVVPGIAATYRVYAVLLNRLAADFRTIIYDYPGDRAEDGARLSELTHAGLVDDLFGLLDHLGVRRGAIVGSSFGSTVTLRALHRDPGRFAAAALQGGFARRRFGFFERLALAYGRRFRGTASNIPLHDRITARGWRHEFSAPLADRLDHFLRENGLTPIASLARRLDLLSGVDLRPILPEIRTSILLVQGERDRLIRRDRFEELRAGLPHAEAQLLPGAGHLPQYTHPDELAHALASFLLPRASR